MLRVVAKKLGRQMAVEAACSGDAAVVAFKSALLRSNGTPHLCLMDAMMPGTLDGFQAIEQIRSLRTLPSERPFIATVSALGTPDAPSRALSVGADMFVRKPLSLRTLETVCLAALSVLEPGSDPTTAPDS
jgi:DNA-binding response OmpR family regulator